jgi:hypothetical protein
MVIMASSKDEHDHPSNVLLTNQKKHVRPFSHFIRVKSTNCSFKNKPNQTVLIQSGEI